MIKGSGYKIWDGLNDGSWYPRRRSRHIRSQMKFFSSKKYSNRGQNVLWNMVRRGRDRNALS